MSRSAAPSASPSQHPLAQGPRLARPSHRNSPHREGAAGGCSSFENGLVQGPT